MGDVGVYTLSNPRTGLFYIGSTVNIRTRSNSHRHALLNNKHYSSRLQEAFNEDGVISFSFIPCDTIEEARKLEIELIVLFKGSSLLCNTLHSGRGLSEETKQKIRDSDRKLKGLVRSQETRALISAARTGKKHTDAAKLKVSLANKGRRHERSLEYRMKMAKARMISVSINDVVYDSAEDASKKFGCSISTVLRRARNNSKRFTEWKIIK